MSTTIAAIRNYPDGSSYEHDKATIIAALREWIDVLESDPEHNPMRVVFVVQEHGGFLRGPMAVGARTTRIETMGMLQWAVVAHAKTIGA